MPILHVNLSIARKRIDSVWWEDGDGAPVFGVAPGGEAGDEGSLDRRGSSGYRAVQHHGHSVPRHRPGDGAHLADHGRKAHQRAAERLDHDAEPDASPRRGGGPEPTDRSHFTPHTFGNWSPVSTKDFYNALREKGFSHNAAAGLTGNAIWESGGNKNTIYLDPPTGANSGSGAQGAMQWEGEGKRGRSIGLKPTLESQIGHIHDEISSGRQGISMKEINAARSAREAAHLVNYRYERPLSPPASDRQRGDYAEGIARSTQILETTDGR